MGIEKTQGETWLRKSLSAKGGAGKKSVKKRISKRRTARPEEIKPTLTIDSRRLSGDSFKVGKTAKVVVTGKIVEESLRNYEAEGRKSFRMEINRVSVPRKTKRSKRK